MFRFLKDFRWDKLKFNVTKVLGRMYYFNFALIWWLIDLIVFVVMGVKISTLIVAIPLGYFTITTTLKWIGTLFFGTLCKSTKNKVDTLLDRANSFQGVPGAGKTSSINQFGLYIARIQWRKLRFEYWLISRLNYKYLSNKLKEKYKEVVKAYNYYKKHEEKFIPCLHSFITIKDAQGRCSYSFTKEHFLQRIAVPYRSVWLCDEISSMFPNNTKGDDKLVGEMCRWIRHFTDSYGLFADIRAGATLLAIREVCGSNFNLYKKQKWVLRPKFLCWLLDIFIDLITFDYWMQSWSKEGSRTYNKASANLKKKSHRFARFILWLERLTDCVGYRQYSYKLCGSKEQEISAEDVQSSKGRYYFPSCLDVQYNDRAFRNLYKCKDMDFEEPIKSDIIMSEEELKKLYNRQ